MLRGGIPHVRGARLRLPCDGSERSVQLSDAARHRLPSARGPSNCLGSRASSMGDLRGRRARASRGRACDRRDRRSFCHPGRAERARRTRSVGQAGRGPRSRWPELRRRTRRSTRPTDPSRCGPTSKVGWRRLARRSAARRRSSLTKADELTVEEALALGLDDRPEGPLATGASADLTPPRVGDGRARGTRTNESRDRRPAVPLSADRRGCMSITSSPSWASGTRTQLAAWAHEEGLLARNT